LLGVELTDAEIVVIALEWILRILKLEVLIEGTFWVDEA
tara:strand:+ start:397 stop:513 length:117 start_codon:yes stop_codon:yes gene_type:complete